MNISPSSEGAHRAGTHGEQSETPRLICLGRPRRSLSFWCPIPELRATGRHPELAVGIPRRSARLWCFNPESTGVEVSTCPSFMRLKESHTPTAKPNAARRHRCARPCKPRRTPACGLKHRRASSCKSTLARPRRRSAASEYGCICSWQPWATRDVRLSALSGMSGNRLGSTASRGRSSALAGCRGRGRTRGAPTEASISLDALRREQRLSASLARNYRSAL